MIAQNWPTNIVLPALIQHHVRIGTGVAPSNPAKLHRIGRGRVPALALFPEEFDDSACPCRDAYTLAGKS
jgi:hypothetical protein